MAITTLITTDGRYGFKKDYSSRAGNDFFAGTYKGNNYDSAVKFVPNKLNFGNGKLIIVTKISFITVAHDANPEAITFSINRTGSAFYDSNSSIGTIGSNDGGNYNFSLERVNADINQINILNELANYLQNGITFYFHAFSKKTGGRFYGPTNSNRPKLEITWTYPITDGTLNSNSYRTGETAKLTINPQDSSLQHDIIWSINGHNVKKTSNLSGNVQNSLVIAPTFSQIGQWFSENSSVANGQVTITTHLQGSSEPLGSITKNFIVNLTVQTCKSVDTNFRLVLYSLNPSSGRIFDGNKYAINKTKINYNCNYYSDVDPFNDIKLQFSGGLNISFTPSNGQGVTVQTVASKNKITAVIIAKSKRGLIYTSNILEIPAESIIYYSPPSIQNINFYRTNGTEIMTEGTKLGGTLQVRTDTQLSNENSTVQIILSNITNTTISLVNNQTYTSNNIFSNIILNTNLNYNITIKATDTLGTTTTENFTLSTAQYLIHFPQGGQGLGLGAVGEAGSIVLGWPLKNFRINDNLDFTNITTQQGFQTVIGGPFWNKNENITSQYLEATGNTNNQQIISMSGRGLACHKGTKGYGLIWDNGIDLWIGSTGESGPHHVGKTYISAGHENNTVYISIPNNTNNGSIMYPILHKGNYDSIMSYKVNDTIEIYSPCYCYLTGNKQGFFITIPLKKSITGITKIKLTQLRGYARGGAGGYLIGGYGDGSGHDFLAHIGVSEVYAVNDNVLKQHEIDYESNCVTFHIEKSGVSFGGTNNAAYIFQPSFDYPIKLTIIE